MRYSIVLNPQSKKNLNVATHGVVVTTGENKEMFLCIKNKWGVATHIDKNDYKGTILYTAADGVIITAYNNTPTDETRHMLLPETHPLFNCGLLAEYSESRFVKLKAHVDHMLSIIDKKLLDLFRICKTFIK